MYQQQYDYNLPTEEENHFKQFLLQRLEWLSDLSVSVRKSYVENNANREDHFKLVALSVELWQQLYPMITGTKLEKNFKKFMPFFVEPRILLKPKYESYLWLLVFQIRMSFEELGLTKIK